MASAASLGVTLRGRASRLSDRRSAFPDLTVEWADAVALAKGASKLFLNARDTQGRLLYSWEVKGELIETAEAEVAEAHRRAVAKAEHPARLCQPFDPAEEENIVLN